MKAIPLFGLIIGAVVTALFVYSIAYTAWANMTWPPLGRFVSADGTRIHVIDSAAENPADTRPTLLMIHGASGNARDMWESLGPGLRDHFRVLAMDRPGMGHSGRPPHAEQLAVQARIAAAVIEDAGTGPVYVVAQSLGSATALRLALDRPDLVRGLVLIAPAANPYPGRNAWYAELASTPVVGPVFTWLFVPVLGPLMSGSGTQAVFKPADPPEGYAQTIGLPLLFRPSQFMANASDVVATKSEFTAQSPRYADITVPTIILTGDTDSVVSPRLHAQALAATIPAAELVTLPGAGHAPHWSRTQACISAIDRIAAMAPAHAPS